jgi:BirA family transcriptional regulator, biotin operon repressor / biotin---[acetyl-CoA-carboxylase] ligase
MTSRSGILAALEETSDFVSGADLAARLGISRAAVWKHISALKHGGYDIEGARARGYRLVAKPSALSEAAIHLKAAQLPSGAATRIGKRIQVLDVTRSTNSDAMALGREGEPEGTVVIAEEQTAGRGRLGRTWESSRGVNLYMSILLRPGMAPWLAPQLSLVAGVAVAETVREEDVDARIKWPNDVVILSREAAGGSDATNDAEPARSPAAAGNRVIRTGAKPSMRGMRKLSGILTEIEAEADRVAFVVVGIGVNLNSDLGHFSPELAGKATSVSLERGRSVDRAAFTARLLARFEQCYDAWSKGGFAAIAPSWRALSVLDGRRVTISAPGETFEGVCAGIDDDGALLVEPVAGSEGAPVRRVLAGDVTYSAFEGGYN